MYVAYHKSYSFNFEMIAERNLVFFEEDNFSTNSPQAD